MPPLRKQSPLEIAVDQATRELNNFVIGSEEYEKALDHLAKLHKMLIEEKSASVDMNTMVVVGANLLGILMIIKHEYVNVVSSKAMSLILKPRI